MKDQREGSQLIAAYVVDCIKGDRARQKKNPTPGSFADLAVLCDVFFNRRHA